MRTDTELLEAIGLHGLCVCTQDTLEKGIWYRSWLCIFDGDQVVQGDSIRIVIDIAVDIIESKNISKH